MIHAARLTASIFALNFLMATCGETTQRTVDGGQRTVATTPQLAARIDPFTLVSPYRPAAHVYRGQLHAHTTNSDGKQTPTAVITAYRAAGYDFVAITDHNVHTTDPGVTGILFIPGVENDHSCQHENRINVGSPAPGVRLPQDVIDRGQTEGSFVQINHPDWPGSYPKNPCWTDKALLAVHHYDAVEVWNASDDATNNNAEKRIDFLLSNDRNTFLTAVDDCHDVRAAYCMTSSVNVFADALTTQDVMAALKAGNFIAAHGAQISSIATSRMTITVVVPTTSTIEYIVSGGTVAKTDPGVTSSTFTPNATAKYVRIRVTTGQHQAWSNPILVKNTSGSH